MTRVDFYILKKDDHSARHLFACRLTEKAFRQGHRVFINTDSDAQLRQLDDLLWVFRDGSFLPHAVFDGRPDNPEPILLGHGAEPQDCSDVLVNLCAEVPTWFGRFERVAELVDANESQRAAARERSLFYKDRGYTLNTHDIG
jgi:DNA polymerase-3 subunit chi